MAKNYTSPERKLELLQMKIGDQLLYDAALRAGYDKKSEIQTAIEDATRQILAAQYYRDHVREGFTANESEVREFFEKNKETFNALADQTEKRIDALAEL